jgi:hypothetical protein
LWAAMPRLVAALHRSFQKRRDIRPVVRCTLAGVRSALQPQQETMGVVELDWKSRLAFLAFHRSLSQIVRNSGSVFPYSSLSARKACHHEPKVRHRKRNTLGGCNHRMSNSRHFESHLSGFIAGAGDHRFASRAAKRLPILAGSPVLSWAGDVARKDSKFFWIASTRVCNSTLSAWFSGLHSLIMQSSSLKGVLSLKVSDRAYKQTNKRSLGLSSRLVLVRPPHSSSAAHSLGPILSIRSLSTVPTPVLV